MTLPIFSAALFVICVNIAGLKKNVFATKAAKKAKKSKKQHKTHKSLNKTMKEKPFSSLRDLEF